MRTNTDGVRPYINKPTHQSVDDLIADLSRGICFPQPALQVDVIATERELGQAPSPSEPWSSSYYFTDALD